MPWRWFIKKLYQAKDLSKVNLRDYIEELIRLLRQSYHQKAANVTVNLELENVYVLIDSAVPLGLIFNELISNVFKHAFPNNEKGELFIQMYKEDETITILLKDNGIGLPPGIDLRESHLLGLNMVFSLFEYQLKGEATYLVEHGLKWQLKFKDNLQKERV